jgi:LCP family protein required for cell wall assembly
MENMFGKHTHSGEHHRSGKRTNNTIGKLITVIQFVLSAILLALIWNSSMLPIKYLVALSAFLLVLFLITFGLQFRKNKLKYVAMVVSVLITIGLALAARYFVKASTVMEDVGGATYKTDNMIVVVREEDAATNILDAKNYRFGYQTAVDQENNELMLEDVEQVVGRDVKLVKEESLTDLAEALLSGKVEAAIYNEAFAGVIEDALEGYSDQVRILYQYGIDTEIEQEDTDITAPFNVYISGIDVSGPITTNSRSDVNIIMTVNPNTRKILLVTTPRDYYVTIPGISGESRDKLTHAGIYGVDASMATLEQLYGIDINYYARVNFTSLITIVDALGGVDVNSDYAFTSRGYSFVEGTNHMDGAAALAFARERYSFSDGDNQRGRNQEALLTAILKKTMSSAILTNADAVLASVRDSVETNMTSDEMAKFIHMQLADPSDWTIESTAATGTGDTQACYSSGSQQLYVMWPDEAIVGDISRKIKNIMEE